MKSKAKTGAKKVYSNLENSLNGLKMAWAEDHSFRHSAYNVLAAFILATILTFAMDRSVYFWLILTASTIPIIIIETVNTSIEAVTDKASPERSHLAKKAKDIGSAAVFLTRIFAAICWLVMIFGPTE